MESLCLPFDPIKRSEEVEKLVLRAGRRKYYRFRAAGFYGGIITADAVGCSFLCAYCWNYRRNFNPEGEGSFYSPEEVANKVLSLARKKGLNRIRISGAEPILGEKSFFHLLEILECLSAREPDCHFILETNGLMLGEKSEFSKSLSRFKNLVVRVGLKGTNHDNFQLITGAAGDYFFLPIQALVNLKEYGINCWPALTADLFSSEEILKLRSLLASNSLGLELELEELIIYPYVEANLKNRRLTFLKKT